MPDITATIRHEELLCDFCGQSDTKWVYPTDDFSQELDPASPIKHELNMLGGWNACQQCYELIESNEREALLDSSLESYGITPENKVYEAVRSRVQRFHDEFFFCRSGEAEPESEYVDPEGYEPGVIKIETQN